VEVTTKHSYAIDYKYIWECTACGIEFKRHSKSIDPQRHKCGRCKSTLVQTKPTVRAAKKSNYHIFVKDHFQALRKQHPKEPHGFIMKLIGELYQAQKAKSVSTTTVNDEVEELVGGLDNMGLDS
jgi:germ cell nuclear acidic protein